MRVVLQRVTQASVKVDGEVIGAIGNGFLIPLHFKQPKTT